MDLTVGSTGLRLMLQEIDVASTELWLQTVPSLPEAI